MMKKFFTLIALVAFTIASYAQTTPNRLIVTMKNGDVTVYNIADVDSLSAMSWPTPQSTPSSGTVTTVT